MSDRSARDAVTSSIVALFAFAGGVLSFIPPWQADTIASVPRAIFFGLVIAVGFASHFAFLGIAAKRLGRNPVLWVVLAVVFFPIASIVGLILFGWFEGERRQSGSQTHAG